MAVDGAFAGVVAGGGQGEVAIVALEQPGQVLHAAADVLLASKTLVTPKRLAVAGHQLHQALGA